MLNYKMIADTEESEKHFSVEITEGEFKGIQFYFKDLHLAEVNEDSQEAELSYTWELLNDLNNKDYEDNAEFISALEEILNDIILSALSAGMESQSEIDAEIGK
jgi:hypothetical protein